MSAKLVSIIGPVGVGKTTLAQNLATALPAEIIYEDYSGNPFHAPSCNGRDDLWLPSQIYFINTRAKQLCTANWPTSGLFVSDYGFCQDRIFAEAKLTGAHLEAYHCIAAQIEKIVTPPSMIVHLDASVATLQKRIATRGRDYEAAFTDEFLALLRERHFEIKPPENCMFLQLDCDKIDLLNPQVISGLTEQIREAI
ncbi:MAG: deoxynucleoside kinase [Phycisphaerae bacterium]|nr:deoxynucleoside kinase [Phycisphaerae bacterium]